jgi:predicted O-linked N-acetylglucosamine transferase (SPINDLY family)
MDPQSNRLNLPQASGLAPASAGELNHRGITLAQQGRLDEAIADFRRAVQIDPDNAVAHGNLGLALILQGRLDEAIANCRRCVELKPDVAEGYSNLGRAWMAQGRIEEALACFRRALELRPGFAEAHNRLGLALQAQGNWQPAAASYRQALQANPAFPEAHLNLGNALKEGGHLEEAVACYRRALQLKPDYVEAYCNLVVALSAQGLSQEAIACGRRAIELRPDYAQAHNGLGNVLQEQGRPDEAIACYRRALQLKPDLAVAHNNLGNALKATGDRDEAIACYRKALDLQPDYAEAYNNLATALHSQGQPAEAAACCRRALELKPNLVQALLNLGVALQSQGLPTEAVDCCRRALELKPDYADAHSNFLYTLQYCSGVTPAALAEAHAEFDRRHAAPLGGVFAPRENDAEPHRRLRLGFVSPDLGRHPVGYFLVRILENLGQQSLDTVCYSQRIVYDDVTRRFQAASTQWRDVLGMTDQRLADQIREDRIDILFDLAGHTVRNRLLVFARKPAPIQITWIGYEGTTGLSAMDYLLADRYVVPEGTERYYREQVLRMPEGYLCYDPPGDAPPVGPLPSLAKGSVTFGSFNNPSKIAPEVVAVWAEILRRVPTARLVMKYSGLGDPAVKGRYLDLFAAGGVGPQRLELLPWSSYDDYLATYHEVDVALDPFPFSGGATTCEALWMGVPVVTCPLQTFASRHSLSYLSNVGLTETIAHDLDEYVELAVALAGDLPRLAALRAGLRERMAASPLCDGKRFAANLAQLLGDVWRQSCR